MTPRDILNELKWRKDRDLSKAEIWFVHRGAPNDTRIITGSEIIKLGNTFFDIDNASLPYHRIFKIIYEGKVIFERR